MFALELTVEYMGNTLRKFYVGSFDSRKSAIAFLSTIDSFTSSLKLTRSMVENEYEYDFRGKKVYVEYFIIEKEITTISYSKFLREVEKLIS